MRSRAGKDNSNKDIYGRPINANQGPAPKKNFLSLIYYASVFILGYSRTPAAIALNALLAIRNQIFGPLIGFVRPLPRAQGHNLPRALTKHEILTKEIGLEARLIPIDFLDAESNQVINTMPMYMSHMKPRFDKVLLERRLGDKFASTELFEDHALLFKIDRFIELCRKEKKWVAHEDSIVRETYIDLILERIAAEAANKINVARQKTEDEVRAFVNTHGNLYKLLGVSPKADAATISGVVITKKAEIDKQRPDAQRQIDVLTKAEEILTNPALRKLQNKMGKRVDFSYKDLHFISGKSEERPCSCGEHSLYTGNYSESVKLEARLKLVRK